MARRIIDKLLYDSLLEAYRMKPTNHSHAASFAGCDRRMAKRAYESGWKTQEWAVPIKDVLDSDTIEARAKRQEIRTEEYLQNEDRVQQARKDALDARAQEGKMVAASRQSALGLVGYTMHLLRGGKPIVEKLAKMLENNPDQFTPTQKMSMLKEIGRFASMSVGVCQEAMRLERLHMGEPEQILGLADLTTMDTSDLIAELREIDSAIRSSTESSHLQLVQTQAD